MLLFAFILFIYSRLHIFTILPKIKINFEKIDIFLLYLSSVIILLYIWNLIGYNLNLDISSMYVRRLAARETIVSSSIGAYILSFSRQWLLLICVYLGIVKKKRYFLAIAVLVSIGLFSLDGTKTSLIIPCVLGALAWLLITNPNRSILFLPITLLLICLVGLVEFSFNHSQLVNDLSGSQNLYCSWGNEFILLGLFFRTSKRYADRLYYGAFYGACI